MEDLKKLGRTGLIDLLNQKTNEYLKMFKEGAAKKEYEACKKMIARITAEIESRTTKKEHPSRNR